MRPAFHNYVGVIDSGLGGISVLQEMTRELPDERFLFFGDSANAPYGEKSVERVQQMTMAIAQRMVDDGVKAIVIACNTATSAAADLLRTTFTIPIVGIEPALKPAATAESSHRVLVMATPVTLSLKKYHDLWERYAGYADCASQSCPRLAKRIEAGHLDAPDLAAMLERFLGPYRGKIDSLVLGCTHYPFVKKQIRRVLGNDVKLYDGGRGTARELRRVLAKRGVLRSPEEGPGGVVFRSSIDTPEEMKLYKKFYHADLS
ncbi:glutamate racemase [uncultured Pseudoramibacter sp.]|uniref:glutamate racemase n=1 Tax=uncultured Pseudoramibacter sp. TaxID=1623493 RepID=UPI0025D4696D|nr:glutamate racemase [uncultured Pseudoramibacter sp.]